MRTLLTALLLLSLAWGAFGGWAADVHASAASAMASVDEPLSLDAQQLDASIADADVTATTMFLASSQPTLATLQVVPGRRRHRRRRPVHAACGQRPEPGDERRARRPRRRPAGLHRLRGRGQERLRARLPAHRRLVRPGGVGGGAPGPAARRQDRLRPGERRARGGQRPGDRTAARDRRAGARDRHRRAAVPGAAVADPAHQPSAQPRPRAGVAAARHQRHLAGGRAS